MTCQMPLLEVMSAPTHSWRFGEQDDCRQSALPSAFVKTLAAVVTIILQCHLRWKQRWRLAQGADSRKGSAPQEGARRGLQRLRLHHPLIRPHRRSPQLLQVMRAAHLLGWQCHTRWLAGCRRGALMAPQLPNQALRQLLPSGPQRSCCWCRLQQRRGWCERLGWERGRWA